MEILLRTEISIWSRSLNRISITEILLMNGTSTHKQNFFSCKDTLLMRILTTVTSCEFWNILCNHPALYFWPALWPHFLFVWINNVPIIHWSFTPTMAPSQQAQPIGWGASPCQEGWEVMLTNEVVGSSKERKATAHMKMIVYNPIIYLPTNEGTAVIKRPLGITGRQQRRSKDVNKCLLMLLLLFLCQQCTFPAITFKRWLSLLSVLLPEQKWAIFPKESSCQGPPRDSCVDSCCATSASVVGAIPSRLHVMSPGTFLSTNGIEQQNWVIWCSWWSSQHCHWGWTSRLHCKIGEQIKKWNKIW